MIYAIFFLTHCIFDWWVVKWKWVITRKSKFLHCFIYTAGFIPAFLLFKVSFWWLLLIFFSHLFIDKTVSPERILKNFKECLFKKFNIQIKKESFKDTFLYWTLVAGEQFLHIAIFIIIINRYIIMRFVTLYLF